MKKLFNRIEKLHIPRSVILAVIIVSTVISAGFTIFNISTQTARTRYKSVSGGYMVYRYTGTSGQKEFYADFHEGQPVVEIADFALANAHYLKTIYIGPEVREIGIWAITNCRSLEKFVVDPANGYFETSEDGSLLYTKGKETLLYYANKSDPILHEDGEYVSGGMVTPDGNLKFVRDNAFYLCDEVRVVDFSGCALESIGEAAFLRCENLIEVTFPESLTSIGKDAFSYCDKLKMIDIPYNVTNIEKFAFFSLSSSMEKIIIHRPLSEINTGKNWQPNVGGKIGQKVPVEETGVRG